MIRLTICALQDHLRHSRQVQRAHGGDGLLPLAVRKRGRSKVAHEVLRSRVEELAGGVGHHVQWVGVRTQQRLHSGDRAAQHVAALRRGGSGLDGPHGPEPRIVGKRRRGDELDLVERHAGAVG